MDNLILYKKISSLPENLKVEVENFIDFLESKFMKSPKNQNAKFGSGKGMFVMKPDFDQPLEDFKEYMEK